MKLERDEKELYLFAFGAALFAIALRSRTMNLGAHQLSPDVAKEAAGLAELFVEKGRELGVKRG